ncbi:MAG: DUF1559 domain-containing protein [Thermoguttaceae bacterium]|jgi:hypothetical protein
MSTENSTKAIVISIVLAVVTAVGLVFCIVVLPIAVQHCREATRRAECQKNLRQIGEALKRDHKRTAEHPAPPADHETRLAFDIYSGYFVSNKFEPNAAESFAVIRDQAQFDKIFGVAMVMGDKSHRLPANAFQSSIVLAAIKRDHAVWAFNVESVSENEGVVTLRYSTIAKKSDTAEFASPLIVSIPKGKYAVVQFIENGNLAKRSEERVGKSND